MGEFVNGLQERVADTSRSLVAAEQDGDDYAVELHSAELADLGRIAEEHEVDITGALDLAAIEQARAARSGDHGLDEDVITLPSQAGEAAPEPA